MKAVHYSDRTAFLAERVTGSFWVSDEDESGLQDFIFFCPCGCEAKLLLTVGNGFKPIHEPSWYWNGSIDDPELSPSVNWEGHWHGWLRNGVWSLC